MDNGRRFLLFFLISKMNGFLYLCLLHFKKKMEQEDFNIREHQLTSRERDFENALRPLSFEDFSGQDKVAHFLFSPQLLFQHKNRIPVYLLHTGHRKSGFLFRNLYSIILLHPDGATHASDALLPCDSRAHPCSCPPAASRRALWLSPHAPRRYPLSTPRWWP